MGDKSPSPGASLLPGAAAALSDAAQKWIARLSPASRERLGFVDAPAFNKPANLLYGVEDTPPRQVIWFSALQQMAIATIYIIYPLIVIREAGLALGQTISILQFSCLVLGIAAVLQALPRGPVGSRLMAPSCLTGLYLASSLAAVKVGGMPLVWGMTIVAGFVEMGLSTVWRRLRAFVPPECAGLIVFFIGGIIVLAACQMLLADGPQGRASPIEWLISAAAIAIMLALHVWSKSGLKIYCVLIGMFFGFLMSIAAGILTYADLRPILQLPLISPPGIAHISLAFDWSMVVPFAITGVAAAMSATAVLTTHQKFVDSDWVRPDMSSIGRGVLGDGIATTFSGVLGTYGVTLSNANAGLVAATGVASRRIAFALAILLALLALQPRLLGVLTLMPRPVMASAMLFIAAFIMISGIQIITMRVLDGRRTLVIGLGLATFFGATVYQSAFAGAPQWAQPIVTTPLVLATLVALGLNLVFRIGVKRRVGMTVDAAAPDLREVTAFIERSAGSWGARRDVTNRLEFAVQQAVEAVIAYCAAKGPITLNLSFDEFVISADILYEGSPMEFPAEPPGRDELLEQETGYPRLAGFLVRQYTDRRMAIKGGVRLQFDH
jgi:NCS2 family nucleobase:cation symporter-2